MRHLFIRIVLVGSSVGALVASASLPGAEAEQLTRVPIVDRSISYHGGERYEHSQTDLRMCSKSGCYDIQARVDGGLYRYDVTGTVRGVTRRVLSSNDRLEMWADGGPATIPIERISAVRDWAMARVYFCFLPFRLNDQSVYKEDIGVESWDGRSLHKVKVTFASGSSTDADDEYLYWFHPETGRLEQLAYSFTGRPGGLRFRKATKYRRIGDILFFDQQNFGIEGDHYSVDEIDPAFVKKMDHISTVELQEIRVEALE